MNFPLVDADFCETCLLGDFELDPEDNLAPRVAKSGKFSLSQIPDSCLRATLERMNQTAFTRMRRINRAVSKFIEDNRTRLNISLFHNYVIRFEDKFDSPGTQVIFIRSRPRRSEDLTDKFPYHEVFGCGDLMDRLEKTPTVVEANESSSNESVSTVEGITKYINNVNLSEAFSLDLDIFRRCEFLQREFKGNYRPCYYVVYVSDYFGDPNPDVVPFVHFLQHTNQTGGFVKFYSTLPSILNAIVEVLRPKHISMNLFVRNNNLVKEYTFRSIMQDVRRMTITEDFVLSMEPGAVKYLMESSEHLHIHKVSINRKEYLEPIKEGLMAWKLRSTSLKTFVFSCDCHITAFVYYKRLFADFSPVDLSMEACIELSSQYPDLLEWIPLLEAVDPTELFPLKQFFFFEGASGLAVVAVNNEARRFQMTVL